MIKLGTFGGVGGGRLVESRGVLDTGRQRARVRGDVRQAGSRVI